MVVGGRELIDTLWNVNMQGNEPALQVQRINRYIMECKFILSRFVMSPHHELIDTLWNVNHIYFL